MAIFTVLLWKHYVVRKRHYVMTFIELLTPIFLLLPLVGFRHLLSDTKEEILRTRPTATPPQVFYTPDNELTRMLMEQVAQALYIPAFNPLPTKYEKFYVMRSKQSKVDENVMENIDGVVIFENMNGDNLPVYINYTMHVKTLKRKISTMSRRRSYEYLDDLGEAFLRLQWAIDSSFIKMKSNSPVDLQNITMKQFRRSPKSSPDPRKLTDVIFFVINGITFLAPMLSFTLIMLRINEEKSTGIQEIVEMAGVTPLMICLTQLLNSLPPSIIIGIIGTMLCYAIPIAAHPVIMFLGWFLHFLTMIAMAFTYSYLTRTDLHTISISMFAYIGSWFPITILGAGGVSQYAIYFKGLLPHTPSLWFFHQIYVANYLEGGIDFSNWSGQFHQYEDGAKSGSVKLSYIMQIIQIVFCFLLTWYLEQVRPRKFGVQKPWYFICQKIFCRKQPELLESKAGGKVNRDPCYEKYFEDPPDHAQEIVNVVKVQMVHKSNRASVFALDNVSVKFYKGEITVIIGHNGAGKTTLISIIAGILEPTSGRVFVEGFDTIVHRSKLKGKISLCPQRTIYFPALTVKEHFIFFSRIRGDSMKKAKEYSEVIMKQLDLFSKATWTPGHLSHGMLRRLQVGCMLCGDADLLLLDEPTTGLDVEARRELWDVLLTLRGHRTVIMTTHILEEAQLLADRVVGLHSGIIRCYATPMFLKTAISCGYRLSMTTTQSPDLHKMTSIVREVSPDAVLSEKILRSVVYDIPPATDMQALCDRLETIRAELDLESMGIGHVTLEEAFIKLCSDVHVNGFYESEPDLKAPDEFRYNRGWTLFMTQTLELFKRQLDYSIWKHYAFLLLQFVLPFVFCVLLTYVLNNPREQEYLLMDLNMYNEVDAPVATYNLRSNLTTRKDAIDKLKRFYPNLILRGAKEKEDHDKICDCEKCKTHKWTFTRNIIDIYIDDREAKLNYDKSVKHSASVGLNVLSNIIAAQRLKRLSGKAINMQLVHGDWSWKQPKDEINCYLFATLTIYIILATAMNDIALPCKERITNTRYTILMAGCPLVLYWTVTLLYHMSHFLLFHCSGTIISVAIFEKDGTLDNAATMRAYFVGLFVCGLNFFVFSYFLSFFFNEKTTGLVILMLSIYFDEILKTSIFLALFVLKLATVGYMAVLDQKRLFTPLMRFGFDALEAEAIPMLIVDHISMLVPMHMYMVTIKRMTDAARYNVICHYYHHFCNDINRPHDIYTNVCCDRSMEHGLWFNHYALSKLGMGIPLIIVGVQAIIFTILVLLMEYQHLNRLWNGIERRHTLTLPPRKYDSSDVAAEKEYIRNTIYRSPETIKEAMLVSRTWKVYFTHCKAKVLALKDVNFSVRKGECFGLLGLNGCGKTTTFKLLTRKEFVTKGIIFGNGYFANDKTSKYLKNLSYSHQSFGLDYFRSGEKNLRMLMVSRGITGEDIKIENNTWFKIIGLEQFRHYRVMHYSGGMTQRLTVGAALCGGAPLMLLDGPTAGIDPAARRLVWEALEHGLTNGRSIVLSSHNMEEVERLCNNLTVLDAGEMGVLGTPAQFKLSYARGHTVLIKLRLDSVLTETGASRLQALKIFMATAFSSALKDDHVTALRYMISARTMYSDIFNKLSRTSNDFADIVEDFEMYDGNMEDGFMQFIHDSRFNIRQKT